MNNPNQDPDSQAPKQALTRFRVINLIDDQLRSGQLLAEALRQGYLRPWPYENGLHRRVLAHSAPQRRHHQTGRYSLRNSFPLRPSPKTDGACRGVGLGFGLSIRSENRRNLSDRFNGVRDLCVGAMTRLHAKMADFCRELGHLFGVALSPSSRWHGSKSLREEWLAPIDATVNRPVTIIEEAQEMNSLVLSELCLLASADLDSRTILTIILAGDQRLATRLAEPDWPPIASA